MKKVKVSGHSNLIRDEETRAIINTNMIDYNAYILQKRQKEKESEKVQTLAKDVSNIKEDLNEIKLLLRSLLDGSK